MRINTSWVKEWISFHESETFLHTNPNDMTASLTNFGKDLLDDSDDGHSWKTWKDDLSKAYEADQSYMSPQNPFFFFSCF